MKIKNKDIFMFILLQINIIWADCPLFLFGPKVEPSPMVYKEDGNLSMLMLNLTNNTISQDDGNGNPSCTFEVKLKNIVLKNNDTFYIRGLNGENENIIDTYFSLDYNNTSKVVTLVQKVDLPFDFGMKLFADINVIGQSTIAHPENGFSFIVNNTMSSIEKFTYTSRVPLVASEDESIEIDGDTGGIAVNDITNNDTINGYHVTLGGDIVIAEVNNTTPIEVDVNSGLVAVPAGTLGGVYNIPYTICETFDTSYCAEANITVYVKNHNPVANDDNVSISEDATVDIAVLLNDTDPDNNPILITAVTQPSHGIIAINATHTEIQYRPDSSYNGMDSFTYTIGDGVGGSAEANVSIEIAGINIAPNASNDYNTTLEDHAISVAVLENDVDTDGDSISIVSITQPSHGVIVVDDENIVYTPESNYYGIDIFTYTIDDAQGHQDSAVVSIEVLSVNDVPMAVDDNATMVENSSITLNVLANDIDIESHDFSTILVTDSVHGTVLINDDETITYTPNEDFNGSDIFYYTMQDEGNATDVGRVQIKVLDNQAPQTKDDNATASVGDTVIINVLQNDIDEDNATDITSLKLIGEDSNGTLVVVGEGVWQVNVEGSITFTPEVSFQGDPHIVEYTVADDLGNVSVSAKITINYIQENPQTVDDTVASMPGETEVIKVLENDTDDQHDIDASRLRIVDIKSGATMTKMYIEGEGTWKADMYGTITFVPENKFMRSPTPIAYVVSDREGHRSKQAKVIILYPTIEPPITPTPTPSVTPEVTPHATATPKPAPKAGCAIKANNDIDVAITSYKGTVIGILGNDGCVEGCGKLSFSQGVKGTVSVDDAGTPNNLKDDVLLYTPEANLCNATDSFEYTITDCKGNSSTATVTLNIKCTSSQTSDGDALSKTSMFLMMMLTMMLGLVYVRREVH